MKRILYPVFIFFTVLSIFNSALASMVDNGGGLIYDTDLNVTWLNQTYIGEPGNTNYPYGTTWHFTVQWVSSLSVGGVSGWRLPLGLYSSHGSTDEIQHLILTELGNPEYGSLINKGLLTELIQGGRYWLGAEASWDKAWTWDCAENHEKGDMYKDWAAYGLAVHDGNIGPNGPKNTVPIPTTLPLLVSGLLPLWLIFRRQGTKKTA